MLTIDETITTAPADACFKAAADVERWPEILPHYRWVRFHQRDGFAKGVVEMAAWRPFGPVGYATWCISEMDHDAEGRRIFATHVGGGTKGMDVRWEVDELPDGRTQIRIVHEWIGPAWPLIGGPAAKFVIGPHFVSHIARRTLAGVAHAAEQVAG